MKSIFDISAELWYDIDLDSKEYLARPKNISGGNKLTYYLYLDYDICTLMKIEDAARRHGMRVETKRLKASYAVSIL